MTRAGMQYKVPSGSITIAPLKDVPACLKRRKYSHIVSMLGPRDEAPFPSVPGNSLHLCLEFDDVGYTSGFGRAAEEHDISLLINFFGSWNGEGHLLIHCKAGTSRSPAAGMIAIACLGQLQGGSKIPDLLSLKNYYRPNTTMLRIADRLMRREGKLIDAARAYPANDGRASQLGEATLEIA